MKYRSFPAAVALFALILSTTAPAEEKLLKLNPQPAATSAEEPLLPVRELVQACKPTASFVRSDSLELPGLTACHQCEWRPKANQMSAADRCGVAANGHPKVAEFECGFSPDCQRVCNFVRCLQ
jgi:hypothetical protein